MPHIVTPAVAEPMNWDIPFIAVEPFWTSKKMLGESILFVRSEGSSGGTPKGSLLFVPTRILSVKSSDGNLTYEEGKDYMTSPGSRIIEVPESSAMPVTEASRLIRPKGSQPFDLARKNGEGEILFGSTFHEYADMQVVVTYEHQGGEWPLSTPQLAERELPGTLKKLRQGQSVKVVLFGDSISEGCQASGFHNFAPYQPPYADLFVHALRISYASEITFANHSKGGMGAGWGLDNIETVANENPDLVILAWGMNDNAVLPSGEFVAFLERQMAAVRMINPGVEFILVSSMLPNDEWRCARPERIFEYRDAMKKLVKPGVAMADVSSVWAEMLKYKRYFDIASNGVNHPNDFGHRIYAQVLTALLKP